MGFWGRRFKHYKTDFLMMKLLKEAIVHPMHWMNKLWVKLGVSWHLIGSLEWQPVWTNWLKKSIPGLKPRPTWTECRHSNIHHNILGPILSLPLLLLTISPALLKKISSQVWDPVKSSLVSGITISELIRLRLQLCVVFLVKDALESSYNFAISL